MAFISCRSHHNPIPSFHGLHWECLGQFIDPLWWTKYKGKKGLQILSLVTTIKKYLTFTCSILPLIDLVTVFDATLTSRQTSEKLQCLYENLMLNNFRKTAVLKKISVVS